MLIKAYQQYLYKPFSGIVIVIDAGHGGKDQGAMVEDVKEAQLNLIIAKKLQEKLSEAGSLVIMTRSDDTDLADPQTVNRKREDMKKRVEMINDEKVDFFISIHMNTYPSSDVSGAQVFYQDTSNILAQCIQNELNPTRTIKQADYYLLRETRPIGVLVECGFISNYQEKEKLKTESYQQEIADKIQSGLYDYLRQYAYE